MSLHWAVTFLMITTAVLGAYLTGYEQGITRWIGLAVLAGGISALALGLIRAVLHKKKIAALHDQLMDFLEGRLLSPRFSVDDDDFALFENAVVELESRLMLEREKAHREAVKNADFIADVSHQLKTPLAALKLYYEMECQGDGVPDTPTPGEALLPKMETGWGGTVITEPVSDKTAGSGKRETAPPTGSYTSRQLVLIERMEHLIKSLLKLEKLRADAYEMHFKAQDLSELISLIWNELQPLYQHKTFRLTGCAAMRCDAHWLGEALQNIIKNSCEHTPAEGRILVRIETTEQSFIITIEDDGGGIPEEELPGLFRRFYRSSRLRPDGGVGLGLAIARTIVEKPDHGGEYGPRLADHALLPQAGGNTEGSLSQRVV